MSRRGFSILCDLDDIVVSLLDQWFQDYNADYGDNLTIKDMYDFDMSKVVKPSCGDKIYDYINSDGYFAKLKPLPGAIESLKALQEDGHEIIIVSSPAESPESYRDKIVWCAEHLPFICKSNIILTKKKYLVKGDIFIDDSLANIKTYREHWPDSTIISIRYPHNRMSTELLFDGWHHPEIAWAEIVEYIREKHDGRE